MLGHVATLLHHTALTSVLPGLVPTSATPIAAPVLVLPLPDCSPSPGSAISYRCQLKRKGPATYATSGPLPGLQPARVISQFLGT